MRRLVSSAAILTSQLNRRVKGSVRRIVAGLLLFAPLLASGQSYTNDAVSREVSVFNFGGSSAGLEAVSREVSVFNFGGSTASVEATSREVSVFNFGGSTANVEAVSREVSVFNFGGSSPGLEAISREVSVFNFGGSSAGQEAISREVSIFNEGVYSADAVSREVSVFNQGVSTLEAISREVSAFNYGYNHFNLAVGSTVTLAGTSGSVPVKFSTLAPVAHVQVAVGFPDDRLTNWAVAPQPPLTATGFISNETTLLLTFSPTNGQSISATQQLGQITFTAVSNQMSAFLPLPVENVTAPMLDGTTITPYRATHDGEVVVLNKRPLLRFGLDTNGLKYLELYGLSDTNYTIESATNLNPPVAWQPAYTSLIPSDFLVVTPDISMTNPAVFYRAVQINSP